MAAPIPANGNLVGTITSPYVTSTLQGTNSVADYIVQNNLNNYATFFDFVQRGSSLVYTYTDPYINGTGVYTLPMPGTANSIEYISRDSGGTTSTGIYKIVAPGDYRTNTTDFGIQNYGTNGNDVVYGLLGANQVNVLNGGAGNDTLVGGAGLNIFTGGSGSNTIIGGTGSNRYKIDVAEGGTQTIQASGADNIIQILLSTTTFDWNFERVGNNAVGYITDVDGNRTDLILKDHFTTSRVDSIPIYVKGFSTSGVAFTGMGFLDPGVGVYTGNTQAFIGDVGSNEFNLTGTLRSGARIFGNDGADTVLAGAPSIRNWFYGGDGVDTFVVTGALKGYTLSFGTSTHAASGRPLSYANLGQSGKANPDYLQNVERLKFTDTMLALDIGKDQTAGSGYMLYKAAFNRTPDVGGLGYWINQMDKGMSYGDVAKNFVTSSEFQTAFGGSNPTVNTLVTKLYNNVLARTPDAGGLAFWQNKLSNEGWSTADVLGFFSTSGENVTNVTPLIANGIAYQQFVG
jgi:hypothetical protein